MQEAWLKVLRSFSSFQGGPTACRWVRAIVANSARDIRRQRSRRYEVPLAETNEKDPSLDPAPQACGQQMLYVLREMVTRLPEPYRQVIELRFEQELSTDETAQRLGISRSNVATRLNRGLRMLRDRFEFRTQQRPSP